MTFEYFRSCLILCQMANFEALPYLVGYHLPSFQCRACNVNKYGWMDIASHFHGLVPYWHSLGTALPLNVSLRRHQHFVLFAQKFPFA